MENTMIDQEQGAQLIADMAQAEQDGTVEKASVKFGPFTAYILIAVIQLAMRHPELSAAGSAYVMDILEQLREQLLAVFPEGSDVRAILDAGMDPEQDVPMTRDDDSGRPHVIPCPGCGGTAWRTVQTDIEDPDDVEFACKGCGKSIGVGDLFDTMNARPVPVVLEIPYRDDNGHNHDYACPMCGGTRFRAGDVDDDSAYRCAECLSIYPRAAIMGQIDKLSGISAGA